MWPWAEPQFHHLHNRDKTLLSLSFSIYKQGQKHPSQNHMRMWLPKRKALSGTQQTPAVSCDSHNR